MLTHKRKKKLGQPALAQQNITYFECVSVALVIQHTMHMHHIILTSVACLALPYFSTLPHAFRGGSSIDHKMCVFIFDTIFVCNISHFKKNSVTE